MEERQTRTPSLCACELEVRGLGKSACVEPSAVLVTRAQGARCSLTCLLACSRCLRSPNCPDPGMCFFWAVTSRCYVKTLPYYYWVRTTTHSMAGPGRCLYIAVSCPCHSHVPLGTSDCSTHITTTYNDLLTFKVWYKSQTQTQLKLKRGKGGQKPFVPKDL